MHVGPFTVRLDRTPRTPSGRPRRRHLGAAVVVVALLAAPVLAVPAGADTNASSTGSVSVLVRSVTVSPSTFTYQDCKYHDNKPTGTVAGLVIPDGFCTTAGNVLNVTNGPVASHLEAASTGFTPSDGGTPWSLCTPVARADLPACTGPLFGTGHQLPTPGTDQAQVELSSAISPNGIDLSSTPQCYGRGATCMETPGRVDQETAILVGPNSSTDQSPTFSNTLTWTVVP